MSAAEHEIPEESAVEAPDLTDFQRRALYVLAERPLYGLAIKRELETYYGDEINHGRLYPNLDTLVDEGLVEKSELDKRTNEYALTEAGRRAVQTDQEWAASMLSGGESGGDGE